MIGKKYIGHIKQLVDKIKETELELLKTKHDIEILKTKNENELLKKDIQILKLEKKLSSLQKSE